LNPQNFLAPGWFLHDGIRAALEGSLMGVPLFSITRVDPNFPEVWRRFSQVVSLQTGHTYAYSFLVQPGSTEVIDSQFWVPDASNFFEVTMNTTTGALTVLQQSGFQNFSLQKQTVGEASLVTLFFTANGPFANADFGISPNDTATGASIHATDLRLTDTADYCR
jgi:hypothetical protein